MKKSLLLIPLILLLCPYLSAQQQLESFQGINYQAAAFDASGLAIANQTISINVSFSSKGINPESFYQESHQVQTDARGVFSLVIGEGADVQGQFADIPWAKAKVWLNMEILAPGNRKLSYSNEIHAVPYAFHAATADQIAEVDDPLEKNQSIRWTTSGNSNTKPEVHYLGTQDARDLVFKSNLKTNAVITQKGQLQIIGRRPGPDTDPTSYPFLVDGGNQGIFIKVNGSRNNFNNFVVFADEFGVWGSIRGQTFAELEQTSAYQLKVADFVGRSGILVARAALTYKQAAFLYSAGTGASASLIFAYAAPGFYGAATFATADGIAISLQASKILLQSITWGTKIREEIGVEYASGSGDYAEALERLPTERNLHFGEIVGVKGGKVSLNTSDADHILVISKAPIVLGNLPQPSEEQNHEKVAFLGQVGVRVVGKVEKGDYILASGNNDGLGVALHPSKLIPGDYRRVVGIAWEAAEDKPLNLVTIGIGLNKNDLAPHIEVLHQKADSVIAYLQGKGSLPAMGVPVLSEAGQVVPDQVVSDQVPTYNPKAWEQQIEANEEYLREFYKDFAQQLKTEGVSIPNDPVFQQLLQDPVNTLKKLRQDPKLREMWIQLDEQMPKPSMGRKKNKEWK